MCGNVIATIIILSVIFIIYLALTIGAFFSKECNIFMGICFIFIDLFVIMIAIDVWPAKRGEIVDEYVTSTGEKVSVYEDSTRYCIKIFDDTSTIKSISYNVHSVYKKLMINSEKEDPEWDDICDVCGKRFCEHYCEQMSMEEKKRRDKEASYDYDIQY